MVGGHYRWCMATTDLNALTGQEGNPGICGLLVIGHDTIGAPEKFHEGEEGNPDICGHLVMGHDTVGAPENNCSVNGVNTRIRKRGCPNMTPIKVKWKEIK